jgi:outer membrane protein TolC
MKCTPIALASACLLLACAAPEPAEPLKGLQVPQEWRHAGGATAISSQWWLQFDDPLLTRLIDEAREHNLDLRQAVVRLEEARATARAQHGAELPQVAFTAAGQRAKAISPVTGRPFIQTVHQEEFQAAYEVDLFGRVAALSAAADASSVSATATRDAVELSLTTGVAATYITLVALDAQLAQAHQTLASRERTLELNRSREKSGYGSTLETAQAEADLHATAQTIPQIELARQRQELALNVLLARAPGPIGRNRALLDAPARELPATGVPSDVLRRRPDVVAVEYQLVAADEQFCGRARAASALASDRRGARARGFVVHSARRALHDLERRRQRARAALHRRAAACAGRCSGSRRDQALIAYQRVVLNSFAEVETQLYAFDRLHEQLVEAEQQRRALVEALRIAHRRYERGYGSFLDELLAQRNLYAVELQLIQLRADRLNAELSVIKALGGGWSVRDIENTQGMRKTGQP